MTKARALKENREGEIQELQGFDKETEITDFVACLTVNTDSSPAIMNPSQSRTI